MEKLISIVDLFKNSFEIYKNNFWTFVKLAVINFLLFLIFLPLGAGFFFAKENFYWWAILLILSMVACLIAVVVGLLVQISFILVVKEKNTTITTKQYLKKSWSMIGSYVWISFLVGLAVLAGFILLIIPGIIFAIWFVFSRYIFIVEGKKGRQAMAESKRLAKGYWWAIFGRFFVIGIFAGVISYIPLLGSLVNLFFTMPFVVIYSYLLYEDLKKIKNPLVPM